MPPGTASEIAVASREQSTGIEQVNQGIVQVTAVTQTNSLASQESAAASEELSGQAETLREQVARFRLRATIGGESGHLAYNAAGALPYRVPAARARIERGRPAVH